MDGGVRDEGMREEWLTELRDSSSCFASSSSAWRRGRLGESGEHSSMRAWILRISLRHVLICTCSRTAVCIASACIDCLIISIS